MFSGLVAETSSVLEVEEKAFLLKLVLKRPGHFKELKRGESIAVDGLCLTLNHFDEQSMSFDLGPETLKVTGWTCEKIKNKNVNLERSVSLQSTLGAQILTGHVDALAKVILLKRQGESLLLTVQIPKKFQTFIWEKAYLALNGVSLTVNKIKKSHVELCLIPETLKQTNLSLIKEGDMLNFEVDYMSRPAVNVFQNLYKKMKWLFIGFLCLFMVLLGIIVLVSQI